MKRIENTSSGGNLSVILSSLALGLALLLSNSDNIRAKSTARRSFNVNPIRARVQQIYSSQIGIREKPINSGPEVEKYLKYVGLGKGNPWCAAFVCWSLGKAGITNPRSGWSPALFRERFVIWGKEVESGKLKGESVHRFAYNPLAPHTEGSARSTYSPIQASHKPSISLNLPTQTSDLRPPTSSPRPQTGDVFGLYFPEKARIAHVGFVDDWNDGWVTTVEGNTNIAGSREGDGVYRKRRLMRSIYKVARYAEHGNRKIEGGIIKNDKR